MFVLPTSSYWHTHTHTDPISLTSTHTSIPTGAAVEFKHTHLSLCACSNEAKHPANKSHGLEVYISFHWFDKLLYVLSKDPADPLLWRTVAPESQLVSISSYSRCKEHCAKFILSKEYIMRLLGFSFVAPFKYQSSCKRNITQRPPLQLRNTVSWCLCPFDKWLSGAGSLSAVCPLDYRPNAQQLSTIIVHRNPCIYLFFRGLITAIVWPKYVYFL